MQNNNYGAELRHFANRRQKAAQVTIYNKKTVFAYNIFCTSKKRALFCKTMHIGLQNPAYWLAKPMVLQRKMMGFGL